MRKLTYEEESFDEIHRKNMQVKDMIERLQKYPEEGKHYRYVQAHIKQLKQRNPDELLYYPGVII